MEKLQTCRSFFRNVTKILLPILVGLIISILLNNCGIDEPSVGCNVCKDSVKALVETLVTTPVEILSLEMGFPQITQVSVLQLVLVIAHYLRTG